GVHARTIAPAVRVEALRRYRSRAGTRLRPACGRRLDREKYLRHKSDARIVALPRRDHLQPFTRARHASAGSMWDVHVVFGSLSDRRTGRTSRPGFDAMHLVSHDRTARTHRGAA